MNKISTFHHFLSIKLLFHIQLICQQHRHLTTLQFQPDVRQRTLVHDMIHRQLNRGRLSRLFLPTSFPNRNPSCLLVYFPSTTWQSLAIPIDPLCDAAIAWNFQSNFTISNSTGRFPDIIEFHWPKFYAFVPNNQSIW